ncbi:MAG: PilZ domain-containing protein [Acidobacteriota bacterium]|nr:PilZ domain-containing protein [Acidobacteriota bacterium]
MEKRIERRRQYSIDLLYGSNDTYSPGTACNISLHGMLIHAENKIVPINHEIKVLMTIDGEIVSLLGIVCWNSEILDLKPEADKCLGVFIPDPHPEYIKYLGRLN